MKTSGLGRFTLGQPLPAQAHAVCVSLPEVKDLIGYEEKDPTTLAAMPTGYPRFVRHRMIDQMIRELCKESPPSTRGYLFTKETDCEEVIKRYLLQDTKVRRTHGCTLLEIPSASPAKDGVTSYFQHTGCGISSRLAEDFLWDRGLLEKRETLSAIDDPESIIRETISRAHGSEVGPDDLLLASSGANAFHALFKSAVEHAQGRGKNIWIRWGWLYLDTIEVMNLYTPENGEVIEVLEVTNGETLSAVFQEYGDEIAGVVTEFPTNPLLQAGDLEKARELCDQSNAMLIIDPTMVSPKNAKITKLADVVVNSLTKYAGWEGDVMMGSLAFPRSSQLGRALFEPTKKRIAKPYIRDLIRMAEQIPFYDSFIDQINSQTMQVAEFLQQHPKIKYLYWAYQKENDGNYEKLAGPQLPGCNLSFEIDGKFEEFFNRLQMLKSPSFGTEFSNCCPYVYLAHYPLIKSDKGMNILRQAGLSPHLLRLSVGLEPASLIIETIEKALK